MGSHIPHKRQENDWSWVQFSITESAVDLSRSTSCYKLWSGTLLFTHLFHHVGCTHDCTQSKCWALSGNIPSQKLRMMDEQTFQWHSYTKGCFRTCAPTMATMAVKGGAVPAVCPSCNWSPAAGRRGLVGLCFDTRKAGAACFRCVFVFIDLLFGIRLLVCEELHYPVTTLSRNQKENHWPLSSPKCKKEASSYVCGR